MNPRRVSTWSWRCCLALATIAVGSCVLSMKLRRAKLEPIVEGLAYAQIPVIQEFVELFPENESRVTWAVWGEPKFWVSRTNIDETHGLTLLVGIAADRSARQLSVTNEPRFYLWKRINEDSHKAEKEIVYSFDRDGWETLFASGGDFRSLGVQLRGR